MVGCTARSGLTHRWPRATGFLAWWKAGGEYLLEEGERSREVSARELEALDPDHIFLNVCGAGRNVSPDTVLERKDWQNIEAVSNGNVAVLDDSVLNQPSPRLLEGVRSMATEI